MQGLQPKAQGRIWPCTPMCAQLSRQLWTVKLLLAALGEDRDTEVATLKQEASQQGKHGWAFARGSAEAASMATIASPMIVPHLVIGPEVEQLNLSKLLPAGREPPADRTAAHPCMPPDRAPPGLRPHAHQPPQ